MKKFLIGLIVGVLLIPVLFVVYVMSGRMPVATSDPPMPMEKFLARAGLYERIRREAPKRDVSEFTTADLMSGAEIYRKDCAFCHGLPGQEDSGAAPNGMFPDPPMLFSPMGEVTDDSPGVTYWKVKNGIRLTGMPGFHASLSDKQMWQVAALVARADKLPPEVLDALKPVPPPAANTAGAGAQPTGQQKP
jgi:thiosulfate dehydrogenase